MAKEIRIYRKTLAADTFGTLAATEKISLNANGNDNKIANMWSTFIHHGSPRGIAEHPNPNQNLSENQDTGLEEIVYEIDFVLSRADLVGNQFMVNLVSFKDGSQENVGELPFGRFSIEIDRNPNLNLISGNTLGLKVRDITFDMDEETANETTGRITLVEARAAV
jgi:hypothetical protein